MASPQKENGYTSIANEILERLSFEGINGSEYRILLVVIRQTYGYNKKKDRISLSQFEAKTHMKRNHAIRTIKTLLSKKILLKEGDQFVFNKNYEEWVVTKRGSTQLGSTQKGTTLVHKRGYESSTQKGTDKRKKEIYTKDTAGGFTPLGAELLNLFIPINPACKGMFGNTTQRKACDDLIKTYSFEEVSKVIAVLPKTNAMPYFPNIQTPYQLWNNYQKLKDAMVKKKVETSNKGRGIIL